MPRDQSSARHPVILELVGPYEVAVALAQHPALKRPKGRRPRARVINRIWHDTPDHRLAAEDLSLVESAGLWVTERLGMGWPRRPGTPSTVLASSVHPAGLEAKLGQALPGPLRPIARFTGELRRLGLTLDGQQIECRIMSGTLTGIDAFGAESGARSLMRAEIEGPLPEALALAQRLARDLPVTPSLTTLPLDALQRGGAKLRPPPVPALDPDMPTDTALAVLISGFVSTFLARLEQIQSRAGTEPVHQARVTLRRIRALMLAFRPILRDIEMALKPPLAELKEVLGPARDWDVFLSETVDPIARSLDDDDVVTGWLRKAAEVRREAAYQRLIEWLRSPAYRDLAWRLVGLGLGHDWVVADQAAVSHDDTTAALATVEGAPAAEPAIEAAPEAEAQPDLIGPYTIRCLEHRWKKTARPTRELLDMPAPELHGLRIKCKKLRYQAEMFQDLVPGKSGRRLIKRLTNAQASMGLLNDGAVATELVRSLRSEPSGNADELLAAEAIGLIRGYGIGHARDSREAVMQAWRKLVRHNPF